jgi:archaellum component FlaC
MNAPTSPAGAEKSHPVELDVEAEISKLVEREIPNKTPQVENKAPEVENKAPPIENNVERIMSSVARLTSSSVNDLQGLVSELQQLLDFLKSEVGRVESEIESVLAGIKIIIETIAPWKSAGDTPAPKSARAVRAGPASNLGSASPPYGKAAL